MGINRRRRTGRACMSCEGMHGANHLSIAAMHIVYVVWYRLDSRHLIVEVTEVIHHVLTLKVRTRLG